MRIALFTDTFAPQVNGVSLTLQRLVRHLTHRNIPYQVFAPECTKDQFFENNVHHFISLPFFLYPECRIALPNVMSIRNQLQQFKPDLIHVATPFNIGLCGLHYSKRSHIPLVSSYHTYFDRYLEYYYLKFASPWIWKYLRWFHNTGLKTFVPSSETKKKLAQEGFTAVELWKRGVDCDLFTPAKNGSEVRERYGINEELLFLYVGRLAPEKDLDVLLEIIRRLPQDLSERSHWLIVGEGPMLDELKQKSPANVTFTGYLSGNALAEIYASSDLFVFPSTTETFGNVVLEASASGIPSIGTCSGGVQEIIQDGVTGILCPPRDAEAMATAITQTVLHRDRLTALGHNARRYALSQSWEAVFDGLLQHYEQACYHARVARIHSA